jgi:Domain of unknown function (DUF4234)
MLEPELSSEIGGFDMAFALNAVTHVMAAHTATTGGKRRNPWALAALNLATVGFYSVYWWYTVNRELRDLGRTYDEPELEKEPALSALAFLLGGCLVVPQVWTAVTTARRIRLAQHLVGATRHLEVAVPVSLLVISLTIHFVGAGSVGALAAVLGATLAFRTAALAYMQTFLNEICALAEPTVEMPVPIPEELGVAMPSQV